MGVGTESPYNAIFGRPLQPTFGAIPSIPNLAMKFATPAGVRVAKGNQEATKTYYLQQIHLG
ncbi:hypothetical protein KSP40_PGU010735 [Platanthera guangdongensis]|uniref:Uncharacterized protein n=1 Tax=Platanthera guangdongensis TaxID=2320717 RepID=A0ABR2N5V9_9ASPA